MKPIWHLIAEAAALAGGNLCASGHDWKENGGRGCPYGIEPECSQTVFRCVRCGVYDYGGHGGPGRSDCETSCEYGLNRTNPVESYNASFRGVANP